MTPQNCAAALSGAIVFSLTALAAQELPPHSQWTDRILATVARDAAPTTHAWDSWVALTPDLSRIAYAARFRAGDVVRETIVDGSERGSEFLYASRPVLSPNGEHLAYIAVPVGDALPAFLHVGRWRLQIQINDRVLGPAWIPVFSPDSRKIAFRAERPGGHYAVGVVDADVEPEAVEKSVVWGPEFIDVDRPVWSADSTKVIYAGARNRREWVVVVGREPYATFQDATGARFSPDGTPVFIAFDGKKHFLVIGHRCQTGFDTVTEPFFRADGAPVYGASEAGRHYIIAGEERIRVPHAIEGVAVSRDGSRTTAWYRDGDRAGQRMVINGVQAGRYYTRVSVPLIHAETGAYIYTAQDNSRFHVVTSTGESDAYEGVLWNPRIRDDGAVAGYVALNGGRLLWKVASLR
jgi:hypothetical protein